mmetsp:Transcript_115321/g.337141  ORF Transcript_115321/g.337141 Transcript_115321/m.337141 type:complete len:273 (-) Transcript_115321:738-1556(-)
MCASCPMGQRSGHAALRARRNCVHAHMPYHSQGVSSECALRSFAHPHAKAWLLLRCQSWSKLGPELHPSPPQSHKLRGSTVQHNRCKPHQSCSLLSTPSCGTRYAAEAASHVAQRVPPGASPNSHGRAGALQISVPPHWARQQRRRAVSPTGDFGAGQGTARWSRGMSRSASCAERRHTPRSLDRGQVHQRATVPHAAECGPPECALGGPWRSGPSLRSTQGGSQRSPRQSCLARRFQTSRKLLLGSRGCASRTCTCWRKPAKGWLPYTGGN